MIFGLACGLLCVWLRSDSPLTVAGVTSQSINTNDKSLQILEFMLMRSDPLPPFCVRDQLAGSYLPDLANWLTSKTICVLINGYLFARSFGKAAAC